MGVDSGCDGNAGNVGIGSAAVKKFGGGGCGYGDHWGCRNLCLGGTG
jgi:hypothetical protein